MPKKEVPLSVLEDYIPSSSVPLILHYIRHYKVHLTITKKRKTILGDYRHTTGLKNHRISVNGNLNPYAFLITLIHELAHLVTFDRYGNRVDAHGKEWKGIYRHLLLEFMGAEIFPADIVEALERSLHNLPASSCADDVLMRVLKNYDQHNDALQFVEQLEEGSLFEMEEGRVFKKGKKLRKRFQCVEVKTGKLYLFSPIHAVKPLG
ncbi:MAG: SprT-like domain-containing protein [Williamsia sp.]|nr:SprT-like domain-containing protein [Williamsia sp.]